MTAPRGPAVVLPGEEGSRPGMVDPWLADPVAAATVSEVDAVVGRDVAAWWRDPATAPDPVAAHLEVVVTGVAGFRSLTARGLFPAVVAGHGVGEFAALVAAGALELDQVVELVHWRAELLCLAPRPSCAGLAAVLGPGAEQVARAAVAAVGDDGPLCVAALDAPQRTVLSGGRTELARAAEVVREAGLELVRLPGRAPCHGPLMEPVAAHLATALADLDWSAPLVPVVPNADGEPTRDPGRLRSALRRHLTAPVLWEATSRALAGAGATSVVEIGAVPVLGPLVAQVHPHLPVHLAAGPGTPVPTAVPGPALAGSVPT
ncbi:ACP S-malonyltransferase [Geodermatophilus arenarius]|uniref:[acyl-carrier-protein] S-malonyltransferase n=1 Tax=Geodermatophilus arenarius TaxID=1137990 RepID=A0ABV9LNF3_9ACTN